MKFSEINPSQVFIKAVLKGVPGTRKTTQAATFPQPIFWFDIDRKIESLLLPQKLGFYQGKLDINYEKYDKWWRVEQKLDELSSNCPYATVVADSVTSLGDVINRQTLGKNTEKSGGKKIGGIKVNTIEDYNAETQALMSLVDAGLSLPCNFIVIGHVIQREQGSLTGPGKLIKQLVTGSKVTGAKIPAYFPEIYHFSFEDGFDTSQPPGFTIYTQPAGDDYARTALPLPFKLENMGERRLYDLIKEAQLQLVEQPQIETTKQDSSW